MHLANDNSYTAQYTNVEYYKYEYQGAAQRILVTREVNAGIKAHQEMHSFTFVTGASGVGKSSVQKEYFRTLGQYCNIVKCTPGLDHLFLRQTIMGALEDNGVIIDDIEQLSAEGISILCMYMQDIQLQLRKRSKTVVIDGRIRKIREGVRIIANSQRPTISNFHLQSLFRCVHIMLPNTQQVIESFLLQLGFTWAGMLSEKLAVVLQFIYDNNFANTSKIDSTFRRAVALCYLISAQWKSWSTGVLDKIKFSQNETAKRSK